MVRQLSGLTREQIVKWLIASKALLVGKTMRFQTADRPEKVVTLGRVSLDHDRFLCFDDSQNENLWCMDINNLTIRINIEKRYAVFSMKKDPTGSGDKLTLSLW